MTKSIFRTALCTSSAIIAAATLSTSVVAQETPDAEAAEEEEQQVIIVTGSRIASPTVDSPAPVQIVTDQVIDDAGVTNIQDLLLENPVFGTPALSRTNSAFLTSGTGVATVDLRDLNSSRTLVLINGRRVVGSLPGTATVDLNVIPTQFIERVDVLTGGSSALYGSDAVAGVVNFLYKTDFEGVELGAQYGITEEGDDERYQMNLTVGVNTDDGRGNIMAHLAYSNETGLLARERANTRVDDLDLFRLTGDPADFGTSSTPFFSSFPPQGRYDVNGTATSGDDFTFDANGNLIPNFSTNGTNGVGANGFNRQAFRTLAVPVERYLFATRGNYEISDEVNVFFEGTFNRTTSSRIIEPFPLQSGGTNGIFPGSGRYPIENFVPSDQNNDGTIDPGEGSVVVSPVVPQEIVDASQDIDGDGLRDLGFTRRLVEFGPRSGTTARDFYRFVVGLNGQIFDDRFSWDVSYNYGQVLENQVSAGQVNTVNFRNALASAPDVDDIDNDLDTTEAICIDPEARAGGCVPINLFGAGAISQAAVDYITAQGTFQTDITQQVVQGNLSGSLFDLPAGPVGIAIGAEYRKESSSSDNDSLTNQGLNAGNALPDTAGSFDVIEGYAEIKVPILADTPGFELLEVGGAVRVADYSTIGSIVSYNGTVTWQPIDDLRLRGTYARSVRAPNIGELFAGRSQTFPSGLVDPCAGIGLTGGGTLGDTCRSFAGVVDNINTNGGAFTLTQSDIQGISGFNGGNPDLEEEEATSYTIGAVITPRSIDFLSGLTLTVDYYNISVENVISAPGRAFALDKCFNDGVQNFCDLITRRAAGTSTNSAGSIQFINAFQINAATLDTEGVDVTANYSFDFDALQEGGRINARVAYTHLLNYDFVPAIGEDADPQEGEIGTAEDRFTATLGYDSDLFRLSFTGTYIGSSTEDDQFCSAFGLDAGCFPTGDEFYLDTQVGFQPTEELELYFGIDNLLDNGAPNLLGGTTFNVTGSDTAADVYDIFGRRYYAGARFRF